MVAFRDLFSFSRREIEHAFAHATLKRKIYGIKLLALPATTSYGKLLIITPKAMGTAVERNLVRRRLKAIYYEERLYDIPQIVIVIAYKAINTISFENLKKFLTSSVQELRTS